MANKLWYCVEVLYKHEHEVKKVRVPNLDPLRFREFRQDVFSCGLYIRIDEDTGVIVPPHTLVQIDVYRQEHYFNAAEEDRPLTRNGLPKP